VNVAGIEETVTDKGYQCAGINRHESRECKSLTRKE
jgi:hypothetical protein